MWVRWTLACWAHKLKRAVVVEATDRKRAFPTLSPGFYRSTEPRDLVTGRIWKNVGGDDEGEGLLVFFFAKGARPVLYHSVAYYPGIDID